MMRYLVIAVMAMASFGLASCADEQLLSDAELIAAIQSAQKEAVDATDLPGEASNVLSLDFSESNTEAALLARELGYEVAMRRVEGSLIGEHFLVYFDITGRELRDGERDEDDREGYDRDECFRIVFPASMTMPDGTVLTATDGEDLENQIDAWYSANPGIEAEPDWVFPIDIIYEDGSTRTVSSLDEFREAYEDCEGDDEEGCLSNCFSYQFPLDVIMGDGSSQTLNTESELESLCDAREEFNFIFPLSVDTWDDSGTLIIVTVNSELELRMLYDC